MPGQTHPAHHIDFEHPGPVGILDIEKAFRLVDAEIVDEDIDLGELRRQRRAALGAAEIDRRRMHLGIRRGLPDFGRGFSDRALLASVDDDFRAHLREPDRGRKPDAARRAGDERGLSCQVEIHELLPNFFFAVIWPAAR